MLPPGAAGGWRRTGALTPAWAGCSEACRGSHEGHAPQVPDWTKDNAAGRKILEHVGVPVFEVPGFRLEGGSIHSDGQGTLIVTEQCLLHPSRNPDLGKSGIEAVRPPPADGQPCSLRVLHVLGGQHPSGQRGALHSWAGGHPAPPSAWPRPWAPLQPAPAQAGKGAGPPCMGRPGQAGLLTRCLAQVLKEYLGLQKVIWLWKGMAGDDAITNGHVDNLASWVRPGVIGLSWTEDENDPQVPPIPKVAGVAATAATRQHPCGQLLTVWPAQQPCPWK